MPWPDVADELVRFEDYLAFAPLWRDQIANVRIHETTRERPVDRFQQERSLLRALPTIPFDTDEIVPAVVSPHARVEFDAQPLLGAAAPWHAGPSRFAPTVDEVRILHQGQVVAQHIRCYQRRQLIVLPDHRLAALTLCAGDRGAPRWNRRLMPWAPRHASSTSASERQPVKTGVHLRRLLGLARVYGSAEVLSAHRQGPGTGGPRRRLRREPSAGGTPAPAASHAHSADSQAARTDRRHRTGAGRSRLFTTVSVTPPTRTLMARRDDNLQARLDRDLAELKLLEIAKSYREVLDEAARKGSSFLEVLAILIGLEQAAREQRALERRLREARLPKQKTLAEYDFKFPKRIPKAAIVRLFDCDFIEQHGCAVLIGPTGTGKSHLLTALGYTAVERGHSVRHTRVVDMINHLTAAQLNGSLGKTLRSYVRPSLLLLDELGYLPIDKRGADLLFQVVAARYEVGSIVITTNRPFREWGKLFDVDNTLATALIDRLMHHGEGIVIQGDSYRMKDKDPDSTDE